MALAPISLLEWHHRSTKSAKDGKRRKKKGFQENEALRVAYVHSRTHTRVYHARTFHAKCYAFLLVGRRYRPHLFLFLFFSRLIFPRSTTAFSSRDHHWIRSPVGYIMCADLSIDWTIARHSTVVTNRLRASHASLQEKPTGEAANQRFSLYPTTKNTLYRSAGGGERGGGFRH